jgi:uncharacterized protein YebE (UPF0316 family)
MNFNFAWSAILFALLIFVLRVCDMSLDTIRVLFVVRGRKLLAWVLGFFQSLIFIIAISQVLTSGGKDFLSILGYAAGFATGNVVGMLIEERLAVGHILVTVISSTRGAAISETLRKAGYAVTEIAGRGKDGSVTVLHCSVRRKEVDEIDTIVLEADSTAFVTAEDVRPVRRGFWRA